MNYQPPEHGDYESNLTVKNLYDLMGSLFRDKLTEEDIRHVRNEE